MCLFALLCFLGVMLAGPSWQAQERLQAKQAPARTLEHAHAHTFLAPENTHTLAAPEETPTDTLLDESSPVAVKTGFHSVFPNRTPPTVSETATTASSSSSYSSSASSPESVAQTPPASSSPACPSSSFPSCSPSADSSTSASMESSLPSTLPSQPSFFPTLVDVCRLLAGRV